MRSVDQTVTDAIGAPGIPPANANAADPAAMPGTPLAQINGFDTLLAGTAQTLDPVAARQNATQPEVAAAEQKVADAERSLATAEARLDSLVDGGFRSIRAVENAQQGVDDAKTNLTEAQLELDVAQARARLDSLEGGGTVRALEHAVDSLRTAETELADFRDENGIEVNPLAGQDVFPVGGGAYNVGYDGDWNNFGDGALHNSDFSFNATDPNHQNGHLGVDIFGPSGAPILATVDGEIVGIDPASDGGNGGNRVWIAQEQPDGSTRYFYFAHLDSLEDGLKVGDEITAGDEIGTLGNTGSAQGTEPHLHFSIMDGGGGSYSSEFAVDPIDFLNGSIDENGQPAID